MEWRQSTFLQREIAGGELLQPVAVRATHHDYARAANARAKLCCGLDKGWRESGRWKIAVVLCGGFLSKRRGDGSLDDKRKYPASGMRNSLRSGTSGEKTWNKV